MDKLLGWCLIERRHVLLWETYIWDWAGRSQKPDIQRLGNLVRVGEGGIVLGPYGATDHPIFFLALVTAAPHRETTPAESHFHR